MRADPQNAVSHYNLGDLLQTVKDYAGAEQAHREAVRIAKQSVVAHNYLGHLLYTVKKDYMQERSRRTGRQ